MDGKNRVSKILSTISSSYLSHNLPSHHQNICLTIYHLISHLTSQSHDDSIISHLFKHNTSYLKKWETKWQTNDMRDGRWNGMRWEMKWKNKSLNFNLIYHLPSHPPSSLISHKTGSGFLDSLSVVRSTPCIRPILLMNDDGRWQMVDGKGDGRLWDRYEMVDCETTMRW